MERVVGIMYPDGLVHQARVYQADRTIDGRIVISYYDLTNNFADSYADVELVDGKYCKNPIELSWDEYSNLFLPYNEQFSDGVISALNGIVMLNDKQLEKQQTKPEVSNIPRATVAVGSPPPPPTPEPIEYDMSPMDIALERFKHRWKDDEIQKRKEDVIAIVYASEDESIIYNAVFFKKTVSNDDNGSEIYEKYDMNDVAKGTIISRLHVPNSHFLNKTDYNENNVIYDVNAYNCKDYRLYSLLEKSDSFMVYPVNNEDRGYKTLVELALDKKAAMSVLAFGNTYSNGVDSNYMKMHY